MARAARGTAVSSVKNKTIELGAATNCFLAVYVHYSARLNSRTALSCSASNLLDALLARKYTKSIRHYKDYRASEDLFDLRMKYTTHARVYGRY